MAFKISPLFQLKEQKEYEFKVDSAHQEVAKKFKALKLAKKTKQ